MNIVLFDPPAVRLNLLPLTYTRPVAGLRCGILTIAEKWEKHMGCSISFMTEPYLSIKFPMTIGTDTMFVDGALLPDELLVRAVLELKDGQALVQDGAVIAARTTSPDSTGWTAMEPVQYVGATSITHLWDVFRKNGAQLRADVNLITRGRISAPITDPHTKVYGAENIFLEAGVQVLASVLNATDGPIYLGRNSIIQEGSVVRGPFAMGERSQLAMGTIIRGDTTIGPACKAGGEINNAIMMENTNKSHYGYLGNAVVGAWCNLGAGTTASNLANSFGETRLWNYRTARFEPTGSQFCGLVMGDYTTTAIGTMFNTATSVGPGCRIFGAGFPRTFIPPFSRGGSAGLETIDPGIIIQFAERMMKRQGIEMPDADKNILFAVHDRLAELRKLPARNH